MKSFFNLFLRAIWKNRVFSAINLAGLSVGMASFIIIILWVTDEQSYDTHNEYADRIVRVVQHFKIGEREGDEVYCPAPLAAAAKNDFPEVANTVRFRNYGSYIISYKEKVFDETDIIFADSTVFSVFTIPLISGNPDEALKSRRSIVISESAASKYFGSEDPVGKMLRLDNRTDFEVRGVFRDFPSASHFHFDFIASVYTYDEADSEMWLNSNFITYILLKPNVDVEQFGEKINTLVDEYVSDQAAAVLGMSWEEIVESGTNIGFSIQPLTDIHLNSDYEGDFEPGGDITTVRIFSLIALFIIIIACINFTNLSTARYTTRLKEVGVRKTFGVTRKQLIYQFFSETFIIVFIAHILAMVLVELSLPYFNDLTDKQLAIEYFSWQYLGGVLLMILIISGLAGSYPSLYLSSFRPIAVIRPHRNTRGGKFGFRSILVILQFFISLVLLSSSLVLARQMNYIRNKNLGFDKEGLLIINNTYLAGDQSGTLKEEIIKNPSVTSATLSGYLPLPSNRNSSTVFPDAIISEDILNCQIWQVDHDYVETIGLKIIEGRNFRDDYAGDSLSIMINRSAMEELVWEEPLGRIIGIQDNSNYMENMSLAQYRVIAVFEDFHYESMHSEIEPMIILLGNSISNLTLRFNENTDIHKLIENIREKWETIVPGQPFSYNFVDQRLERLYQNEINLNRILNIFTLFAFFVSSLGLIGLSIFATNQRRKEIGLRKVNGSTSTQIIWLLTLDFTRLIAISFVISIPVTVIIMQKWLGNFAYRTNIGIGVFIITGAITVAVALSAIIIQSYKAAITSPVKTLRDE
jgi:putative ABC transport system permease protein